MSEKFSLNVQDWKKIGIGALVAVAGALLTYLSGVVANTNFGVWTPMVVSLWAIVANIIRKWISGS